jgi:hypothetical protein
MKYVDVPVYGEGEIDRLPERETVLLSEENSTSRNTAHVTHANPTARSDGSARTVGYRTGQEGVEGPN